MQGVPPGAWTRPAGDRQALALAQMDLGNRPQNSPIPAWKPRQLRTSEPRVIRASSECASSRCSWETCSDGEEEASMGASRPLLMRCMTPQGLRIEHLKESKSPAPHCLAGFHPFKPLHLRGGVPPGLLKPCSLRVRAAPSRHDLALPLLRERARSGQRLACRCEAAGGFGRLQPGLGQRSCSGILVPEGEARRPFSAAVRAPAVSPCARSGTQLARWRRSCSLSTETRNWHLAREVPHLVTASSCCRAVASSDDAPASCACSRSRASFSAATRVESSLTCLGSRPGTPRGGERARQH
jgi:hypothetical protein